MTPHDPSKRDRLLGLAREHGAPSADDRARIRAGVNARLAAPPAAASGLKVALISGGLALAVGAGLLAWHSRTPPPAPVPEPAPVVVAPAADPVEPVVVPEPPKPVETAAPAPEPKPRRRALPAIFTPAPVEPPPASGGTLAEELRLVARARTSLARGDAADARVAVDEHARRFPSGALAEEREVLAFDTLCAQGQREAAATRGAAFVAAHPGTSHAARLTACPAPR